MVCDEALQLFQLTEILFQLNYNWELTDKV